jgi:DNA-binding LacI/PurR family transcriptional regulator
MPPLTLLSAANQVAAHLRNDLIRGRWTGTMPGVDRLAVELGVNRKTVDAAVQQLEREGILIGQGLRRKRRIAPLKSRRSRPMRVAILLYDKQDSQREFNLKLPDALANAGHTIVPLSATLVDLKMDVARVRRFVKKNRADAWVVMAGPQDLLKWFASQSIPVFALFGRREGLPIPAIGPDYRVAIVDAVRHLTRLGHRRIVLLCRRERRMPTSGPTERAFLDELKAQGLSAGEYNLPDWEETREGLRKLLNSLFKVTPPTALIIDEPSIFIATQQFLAENNLRVPQQVSLISTESNPEYSWCMTEISHFRWDYSRVIPRINRWAQAVSHGRKDVKQTFVPAEFVHGGTIGPAPKS